MDKGYIHIYTGNGKGKTTAAFGLAVRAACAGLKVYIGQFVKDMKYHEVGVEKVLPNIKIEQLGKGCFIDKLPDEKDKLLAKEALDRCAEILKDGKYDVVILDEINIALYFKLLNVEDVIEALEERKNNVEVVLTGRYAPKELIEIADLVTEIKEVKHYYEQGVLSRKGIDN
ncbi:cobinamide adenolsyltransferase [Fervidicella metallireducens AeB]|uniref:Cobinamide adenolsyltransferase n=1 Tax=Fervidicella metallireducens AeB TaxID=1403537 RepID=A0A017RU82_9CLOT|nr:cob(I)yrinic acid a,c-diamide adenosyltransferase [Fervidicella metallireducens]EYE88237.1 cobinamide adenolsyltransferase [Fervidicella metallireducens AeB]